MTASGRSTNSSRTFPTAVTEETISRDLLTSSDVITSSDADLSTPFVVLLDARFTGGPGRQGQSSGSACLQSFPLSLRDWAAHASIMTPHAGRQPSRHDRRKFTLAPTAERDSRHPMQWRESDPPMSMSDYGFASEPIPVIAACLVTPFACWSCHFLLV